MSTATPPKRGYFLDLSLWLLADHNLPCDVEVLA